MKYFTAILLSVLITGCTSYSTSQNIQIEGILYDENKKPVSRSEIYFAVYKYRLFSMPDVAEHGTILTDENGFYSIDIKLLYDAIDISFDCTSVLIEQEELKNQKVLRKDIYCNQDTQ